jgi:Na+/H+ antiporter NhaA
MTDQLSREDSKRLLELFERHHGNQRKIYVAIGVVVTCMTAVLLYLFWFPTDTSWRTALAFCLLAAVGGAGFWFLQKVGKENAALMLEATELGKKMGIT